MFGPVRAAWVVSAFLIGVGIYIIVSRRKKAIPRYEVLLAEAERIGGCVGFDTVLLPEGAASLEEVEANLASTAPEEPASEPEEPPASPENESEK